MDTYDRELEKCSLELMVARAERVNHRTECAAFGSSQRALTFRNRAIAHLKALSEYNTNIHLVSSLQPCSCAMVPQS